MSERSRIWPLAAVIVLLAAVYSVGNGRIPLWDRDEPRNAQAARQMYQTGDWVVPRFLDQVRTAKPVFTYWCQVLAMHIFGDNSFAARLPSVIGMTLTLLVLGWVLYRKVSPDHALWTVLILGTSAMVIAWCGRNALTDGMLLLWITIAQLCLLRVYETGNATWPTVIIWSAAAGLAALTKGPVIIAVQGMTLLALLIIDRGRWRWRISLIGAAKFLLGCLIIAAIVGPWLWLVEKRSPGFILTSASHDVFRRMTEPLEQHKGPPGYYVLTLWGTFFPWSLFLPMAIIFAWRHRADPRIRFALAAVVGPLICFEAVQTKLPHYVLPCFPPLAFLTADALLRNFRREEDDVFRPSFLIAAAIWSVAVVALGLAPWLAARAFDQIPVAATIAWTVTAIAYAATVFALFVAEKPRAAVIAMAGGMTAAMVTAFAWYLPSAPFFRLSITVADCLKRDGATIPGQVQMIGYKEPSLAFYQGGTIREQPENDFLITHPQTQWPKWLSIRSDVWNKMPPEIKDHFTILATCHGWAYVDRGRIADIVVVRKKP
jgi:4-amino-4-deoxy-L-arabinose transferase-like glycosyltransferase